jgi:hypothetical protein
MTALHSAGARGGPVCVAGCDGWHCACRFVALAGALAGGAALRLLSNRHSSAAGAQQLQGLQLSVMRFADECVGRTREALVL